MKKTLVKKFFIKILDELKDELLNKPITQEEIHKEFYELPIPDDPLINNVLNPEHFSKLLLYSKDLFNFKNQKSVFDVNTNRFI